MTDHLVTPTTVYLVPCVLEYTANQPNSGSILGRVVATCAAPQDVTPQWVTPTFEPINEFLYTFEKPRYSAPYLQRVHLILIERDLKVTRLEQSLAAIHEASRAKQDLSKQRNPSRHVAKKYGAYARFA